MNDLDNGGSQDNQAPRHPLTDKEVREIREHLEQRRRMKWLWDSMVLIAKWLTIMIAGIWAAQEALARFVRSLAK